MNISLIANYLSISEEYDMTLTLTFKTVLRSHQSWYHLEDTSVSIVEFFII